MMTTEGAAASPPQGPELIKAVRDIIRTAVVTLASVRDPDARFLGLAQPAVNIVHDLKEAYGYSSAKVRQFQPTPKDLSQMELVMPWLAWLRREKGGQDALRRIIAWAMGVQLWRLGQREGCSDRTILNRIDRSVVAIIAQFANVSLSFEDIDERGASWAVTATPLPGPHGAEAKPMKVYVGGDGYFRGGKRLRNGQEVLDPKKFA